MELRWIWVCPSRTRQLVGELGCLGACPLVPLLAPLYYVGPMATSVGQGHGQGHSPGLPAGFLPNCCGGECESWKIVDWKGVCVADTRTQVETPESFRRSHGCICPWWHASVHPPCYSELLAGAVLFWCPALTWPVPTSSLPNLRPCSL